MAGLYVHVPFCAQRCTYCDFYFVTTARSHAPFVRAVGMEAAFLGNEYGRQEAVETIYLGGGTPSVLRPEEVSSVLGAVQEHFDATNVSELTLELNPEDAHVDDLRALRLLGVNRLSIGIQSFFAEDLEFMNRCHNVEQAEAAIDRVRAAGFENFSVDLIFGVPGQPDEYWAANLEKVVRLGVPHLSTYGLTVEEKTPLGKQVQLGRVTPVAEERMSELFRFTMSYLADAGYEHYEISNFALPDHRARHNQLYWNHRNYIGLGPSAHSFWWRGLPGKRWANIRNLKRYLALIEGRNRPVEFEEVLDLDTLANEYIMLRVRTADGLDLSVLENQYGVDLYEERLTDLAWLESEGYIRPIRNDRVCLSDEGKLIADTVTTKLLLG